MRSRRDLLLGFGAAGTTALAGYLGSADAEPGSDDGYAWSTPGADIGTSRTVADGDVGFVTAADGKLFATTDAGWEDDGSTELLVLS